MKNILKLLFINLFIFTSCGKSSHEIDFLNSKDDLSIFTYKTDYDELSELKNLSKIGDIDDIKPIDAKFVFVYFDGSKEEQRELSLTLIDDLHDTYSDNKTYVCFYNYSNLKFLKGSKFNYEPKLDNYDVKDNTLIVFAKEKSPYDDNFWRISNITVKNGENYLTFTEMVIDYTYHIVYEVSHDQ